MIRDILSDIFSSYSSFGSRYLATLIALLTLIAVGLVGLLVFVLVDSVGITPTKTTATTIEVKQIVPAHTTIILMGKILAPQYHLESYRLHFKIDKKETFYTVEKKFFDDTNVGDRIEVDYSFGRLIKSHQPTEIRLVDK